MGAGSIGAPAHNKLLMKPVKVAVVLLVLLFSARLPAAYAAVVGRKPHGFSGVDLSTWADQDHLFRLRSTGRHLFATSSSSNCTFTFGGAPITFQVCTQDASGFTFRWNDLGSNVVQVSVSDRSGGWIGFGLGSRMVGSSAVIAFPASGGNSAGGVYANQYYLGGESSEEVLPGGSLQLSTDGLRAEYSEGVMTMLFTLTLGSTQYPRSSIIFARGGAGDPSTGQIPQHSTYYQGSIDWEVDTSSGSGSGAGSSSGLVVASSTSTVTKAHGFLQALVWTIFFPAGIISARFFRHVDPVWWHLHRAFQGLGFVVFAIALGLGLKSKSRQSGAKGAHTAIAIALLVAIVAQVLAVVFRPKKDAKVRPLWNQYHHWVGRSAIVLAIVNIYIGLHLYNAGTGWETAYTVVWVAALALYAVLEIYWRLRGPWSKSYSDLRSSGANPGGVGQTKPALSTPGGEVI